MFKNNKHISFFILTFALVFISMNTNAQQVRVIDNKGTIQNVNNNSVTTSTTAPVNPVENDVWFDTTNNIIKIYDVVDGWKDITTITPQNIYTVNGTLTSDRTLTGAGNFLRFTNFSRFDIDNSNFININSNGGFLALRARDGIDMLDSDVRITENLYVVKSYRDSNNDPGTSGQILSSTVTGTDWIDNQKNTVHKTTDAAQSTPATFIFPVGYTPIEDDMFVYELTSGDHSTVYIYNDGAWEKIVPNKGSRIFYPPSISIDASTTGTGLTKDLYLEYFTQFNTPTVASTGAPAAIPTYARTDLYYYVTYFDPTIFSNVAVDANGNMTYDIIATPSNDNTLINVVFVVK